MKKLLLILLCLPMIGFGQDFIQIPNIPHTSFVAGDIAFSDTDNDGDEDVLIAGASSNGYICELYTNNGLGIFSLVTATPFTGTLGSSIAFSDIDNDGDEDVLIAGTSSNGYICELYTNNGLGIFSLVAATPFTGFTDGSIAFSDIDNDGDEDVLITGRRGGFPNYNSVTELYTNDGSGNFSVVIGSPFPDVFGWAGFSDIDGDEDLDVLITGRKDTIDAAGNSYPIDLVGLYTNDGLGNFTMVANTPFQGVYGMPIAFSDIDNDGDEDLLISGRYCISQICLEISELYKNDGLGNFSLVDTTTFAVGTSGSIDFSDVDNDGDEDVLIIVWGLAELYHNDGLGNFSLVDSTTFDEAAYNNSAGFSDIDNDGDNDILIIGGIGDGSGNITSSSLYRNNTILNSINDARTKNQKILKITDLLGRETKGTKNEVLFYIYDDGTVEKRIVVE